MASLTVTLDIFYLCPPVLNSGQIGWSHNSTATHGKQAEKNMKSTNVQLCPLLLKSVLGVKNKACKNWTDHWTSETIEHKHPCRHRNTYPPAVLTFETLNI